VLQPFWRYPFIAQSLSCFPEHTQLGLERRVIFPCANSLSSMAFHFTQQTSAPPADTAMTLPTLEELAQNALRFEDLSSVPLEGNGVDHVSLLLSTWGGMSEVIFHHDTVSRLDRVDDDEGMGGSSPRRRDPIGVSVHSFHDTSEDVHMTEVVDVDMSETTQAALRSRGDTKVSHPLPQIATLDTSTT
jgi:hypothetical protein